MEDNHLTVLSHTYRCRGILDLKYENGVKINIGGFNDSTAPI